MSHRPMRARAWLWPVGLGLALAASAGSNVFFMVVASRDPSFAVEPDYYRKSLEWDRVMDQEKANRALGWTVAVEGAPSSAPGRVRLVARIADGAGRPLDGSVVTLEALHGARAAAIVQGELLGVGDGRYAADLPLGRRGLWELRVRVQRGDDVFTRRLSVDLPGRA